MNEKEKFGINVRQRRISHGYSQDELAELSSLHRTYVGSIERGERNVSLLNIVKIAKALNCKPSELLSNIDADCIKKERGH